MVAVTPLCTEAIEICYLRRLIIALPGYQYHWLPVQNGGMTSD